MNTPFQDTKIDQKNIQIYQEIPESEFVKNVYPEAQKYIINSKLGILKSQSSERSPLSTSFNIVIPSFKKISMSQASLLQNSKQNFLPNLNTSNSGLNDSKIRFSTKGESPKYQSFTSNFTNIITENDEVVMNKKPQTKTIYEEDKLNESNNVKLDFLKSKYDKTMRNSFFLKTKYQSSLIQPMKDIRNNQSTDKNKSNNNGSVLTQKTQPTNLLGIFLQKEKQPNAASKQNVSYETQNQSRTSILNSTYKYDKIYKLFVEQQHKIVEQQKIEQQQVENVGNQSKKFTVNDKSKLNKQGKPDLYLKAIKTEPDYIDTINTSTMNKEIIYQFSPIQNSLFSPNEQQQKTDQKFFKPRRKTRKDLLSFLNNPLSLQGASISTISTEQRRSSQHQVQEQKQHHKKSPSMFNYSSNYGINNTIQKIFIPIQQQQQQVQKKQFKQFSKDNSQDKQQIPQDEKKSFINNQLSSSQILKPLRFTQSLSHSINKNQIQAEPQNNEIDFDKNTYDSSNNIKLNLQNQTANKDNNTLFHNTQSSELFTEDSKFCSPILNPLTSQNLYGIQQNEDFISEDGSKRFVSMQKILLSPSNEKSKKVNFILDNFQNLEKAESSDEIGKSIKSIQSQHFEVKESLDMNQRLINQPSISIKLDNPSEGNNSMDQNVSEDGHGFTLKKIIDFDQLKELRDKTINRFNTIQKTSPSKESCFSNRKVQNSPSKPPLVSPKENEFNFQKENLDISQPLSNKEVDDGKKQKLKKNISSLRQYFRKVVKKKPKKKVEEKNEEEKQREQDLKIAEQIDSIKDKITISVKEVLRQQIQSNIQTTLSQQLINNTTASNLNSINNNYNTMNVSQNYENQARVYQQLDEQQQLSNNQGVQNDDLRNSTGYNKDTMTESGMKKDKNLPINLKLQRQQSNYIQNKKGLQKNASFNITSPQNNKTQIQNSSFSKYISQNNQNIPVSPNNQQFSLGNSKYSNFNLLQRNSIRDPFQPSPNYKSSSDKFFPSNPSNQFQQKDVQEYSVAIMDFFSACVDNMRDNSNLINHDFKLRFMSNFNENLSNNLVNSLTQELKNIKMSDQDVERFKFIYEINAKMHIFYQGVVQLLGGVHKLRDLVSQIIKKISSNLTILPVNHRFNNEQMHRRIIPGICALLCDDHRLFYSTIKTFTAQNSEDFSFIDFFFVKKYIYSFLKKEKSREVSQELILLIMQKVESVRRFIFPIGVLADPEFRENVSEKLFKCEKFMMLFSPIFQINHLNNLINIIYDYFYADSENPSVFEFSRIRKAIDPFIIGQATRKLFDYIEVFTKQELSEDPFTFNMIIRDLTYKFTKIRLRYGFKQGIFGIIKFQLNNKLIEEIEQEITNQLEFEQDFDDKETEKVKDLSFFKSYLRFIFCEYDIFSVYDASVSMSYFSVTLKSFQFWVRCLQNIILQKYQLESSKVDVLIKFVESCCPTS